MTITFVIKLMVLIRFVAIGLQGNVISGAISKDSGICPPMVVMQQGMNKIHNSIIPQEWLLHSKSCFQLERNYAHVQIASFVHSENGVTAYTYTYTCMHVCTYIYTHPYTYTYILRAQSVIKEHCCIRGEDREGYGQDLMVL